MISRRRTATATTTTTTTTDTNTNTPEETAYGGEAAAPPFFRLGY